MLWNPDAALTPGCPQHLGGPLWHSKSLWPFLDPGTPCPNPSSHFGVQHHHALLCNAVLALLSAYRLLLMPETFGCLALARSSSLLLWDPSCRGRQAVLPALLMLDGMRLGALGRLGMAEVGLPGACGASLQAPQWSPHQARDSRAPAWVPFSGADQPLFPAWPEVFAGVSQAAANLGEIITISAGKGGK